MNRRKFVSSVLLLPGLVFNTNHEVNDLRTKSITSEWSDSEQPGVIHRRTIVYEVRDERISVSRLS